MRSRISALVLLFLVACGGSAKFLEQGGTEVDAAKNATVQRTVNFQTTGVDNGTYTFAATTDATDTTVAIDVSSADTSKTNGKAVPIVVTAVLGANATGRGIVQITATRAGESRYTALTSFFLVVK